MYLKKKVEQEEGKRSFSDSCFYIFHLRMTWSFLLVHSFFCIVQKVRYGFPYLFHWPMFWLVTKKENLLKRDWILCGSFGNCNKGLRKQAGTDQIHRPPHTQWQWGSILSGPPLPLSMGSHIVASGTFSANTGYCHIPVQLCFW